TTSRRYMGPLPQAGGWVKLEVSASAVGLEAKTLNGMAFTLYDGQAWWDKPGKSNEAAGGPPNPIMGRDGFDNLTYNLMNNRITSPGFAYDPAGNQTRAVIDNNGTGQQYRYDCANRLTQVLDASGNVLATHAYGASNQRLMSVEGGAPTYFAWAGGKIIAEYEASGANALVWKTSYVYLGGQLLATTSGAGGTETRFHHPDRLGTRLTTDAGGTVVSEQWTMPFGNMQPFTSVPGGENPYQHPTLGNPSKKRFTSYDRDATGLDYAVNRFYSPQQGRFTQVDPIGMGAAELANPQSLNLYAYIENDPINSTDPSGLDGIEHVLRGPFPTGGGGRGGGGIGIGPFSFSFSFSFGSLQQSKKNQQAGGSSKTIKEGAMPAEWEVNYGDFGPDWGVKTNKTAKPEPPSLTVSLIPVYGDSQQAGYHFELGNYGQGTFHLAMAISDIGLVKSILSAVVKGGAKLAARKAVARESLEEAGTIGGTRIVLGRLDDLGDIAVKAGERRLIWTDAYSWESNEAIIRLLAKNRMTFRLASPPTWDNYLRLDGKGFTMFGKEMMLLRELGYIPVYVKGATYMIPPALPTKALKWK
ncbi:MAG: RHS repeat domain-containing protein, partial [Blastocatellia bacterium]